jgi:hypothetical protein
MMKPTAPRPAARRHRGGAAMHMTHARGTFQVALAPQPLAWEHEGGPALGRMSIDKRYGGDLEATGKGEMLTAHGTVEGSAGYVAIERVSGTLRGRQGSFVLQHSGCMDRGGRQLAVTVVPDSATGDLAGLSGRMTIAVAEDGSHSYDFAYTLSGNW